MADYSFFYFFFTFFPFCITPTTNASPILPPHHHLGVASHASPHTQLDAIERFRQYLRIPTVHPNPDYHPAVQFLLSQAASIRFDHTHVVEFVPTKPVLVFTWTGSDPSLPSILLNSHMDVVPVERSKWKYDPFAAVMEENGDIYARGAQDMKCVGMQYLEAIRNLQESGFKPLRTIHVSFVPDEEINSADGFGMFISSSLFKSLNVGVGLDEGGVSESERYNLFIGERIPWDLEIKAVGEPGHGSKLYDNSALENLFKSIEAIMRFRASQLDLIKAGVANEGEVISVNPVFLKAGTPTPTGFVMNVQPSEAKVGFDIRVPPFTDTEALENRIFEDWAPAARNMTHKYVNKVDIHKRSSITPVDETNPWFGLLVESVSRGGGKLASPEIFRATTDARFVRDAGIPAFGMSPVANTTSRAHSHNEYINAWQFLKGITVYEEILKGFSSFNDRSCSLAYCKVLGNRAYLQESQ